MKRILQFLFILVFLFVFSTSKGQDTISNSTAVNKKRLPVTIGIISTAYVGAMTGLYFIWYSDYPQTSFHWINDNENWLQMDKIGHAGTVSVASEYMYHILRWSGLNNNKSAIYGTLAGWGFLATIEVFDGFSEGWGASWGDLLANTGGAALFLSQQLTWKEQRFRLKFSYFPSDMYAPYCPSKLGENHLERLIKDYNSQTYWLSANIGSFLRKDSKFPKWINVAVGYGAKGMLGAKANPSECNGEPLPHYERVRQYYLSMDVDWTKIKTDSKVLGTVFKLMSFIKLPFPALEINKEDGAVWHWIFY